MGSDPPPFHTSGGGDPLSPLPLPNSHSRTILAPPWVAFRIHGEPVAMAGAGVKPKCRQTLRVRKGTSQWTWICGPSPQFRPIGWFNRGGVLEAALSQKKAGGRKKGKKPDQMVSKKGDGGERASLWRLLAGGRGGGATRNDFRCGAQRATNPFTLILAHQPATPASIPLGRAAGDATGWVPEGWLDALDPDVHTCPVALGCPMRDSAFEIPTAMIVGAGMHASVKRVAAHARGTRPDGFRGRGRGGDGGGHERPMGSGRGQGPTAGARRCPSVACTRLCWLRRGDVGAAFWWCLGTVCP